MNAAALLGDLAARGVCLTVDGDELVVEGPGEVITPDLIARLRQQKPDILVALAPSPEWTAEHWRETYEERLAVAITDGEQPEPEARRIAWECCIVRWLDLHPVRSAPDHCTECGRTDLPGNIVPFGAEPNGHAWLHPGCWERWHARRRAEAVAALVTCGITIGDDR